MKDCRVVKLCGKKHFVYDGNEIFTAFPAGRFELKSEGLKNRLAVGDFVKVRIEKGKDPLIVEILKRKNKLSRKMSFTNKEHIIAANIDEVGIVVAPNPVLKRSTVDRFVVACKSSSIDAFLIINKTDLLPKKDIEKFLMLYKEYGFQVFLVSALKKEGLEQLSSHIKDKWTLLLGHSGVGKSSIANILCPDANFEVGEVDETTLKGKHKTTSSTAVKLPQGGFLIDTAGLREFGLYNVSQREIQSCFKNIDELSLKCKFSNCTHRNEKGCAVLDEISKGNIDLEEYNSYLTLIREANDIPKG